MFSRATEAGLWTPPHDAVSTIAAALKAHWLAAKAAAQGPFWGKRQNWQDVPRHYLNQITTSR